MGITNAGSLWEYVMLFLQMENWDGGRGFGIQQSNMDAVSCSAGGGTLFYLFRDVSSSTLH